MNTYKQWLRFILLCAGVVPLILASPACPDPDAPTEDFYSEQFFPYVRSDAGYTTFINLLNNGESAMEAEIFGYDANGAQVFSEAKILHHYEIYRFSRADFTGWIRIRGHGSKKAVEAQLEMWGSGDSSLALEMPATVLLPLSYCWFYHLGVTDSGVNSERTTVFTLNHIDQFPIYITYMPLIGNCLAHEVQIPAYGLHWFNPYDIWQANIPQGIANLPISASGNTGPTSTGSQLSNFSGGLFYDLPSQDIAMLNYRALGEAYWNQEERENAYLVDVRDDGSVRTDKIFLKDNSASNYPPPEQDFEVHFYNNSGSEVAGSPKTIALTHMFDTTGSHTVISPKALLGQSFSGSVWITQPGSSSNIRFMEVMVKRQSPRYWVDFADDSPGKGPESPLDWEGVVPYVSTTDDARRYSCSFFFPQNLHAVSGAPEIEADTYGNPGTDPPEPKNGVVVLTFKDSVGNDKGWFAFLMQPNQTRTIAINSLTQHLGAFTGSIRYKPMIPQQVELASSQNKFHGTAGYQRD
jgi:hypothetical protein